MIKHIVCFKLNDGESPEKAKEVLPRLIELYQRYPDEWRWDLLKYGWYFKDVSIIPYIEPYLTCDDGEYRSMAKKAMQKLSIVSD